MPTSRRSWESTLAFRNDQYLWWQVAEYTYDTYLIRNRTPGLKSNLPDSGQVFAGAGQFAPALFILASPRNWL